MTLYFCCDENRRNDVLVHPTLNGIDFLEVQDDDSMDSGDRQRFLDVLLLKPPAVPLTLDNIRVDGGEAVRSIRAIDLSVDGRRLTVEVDKRSDFSPYTLRLVATFTADDPPAGYDRLLSVVDFSFKVNCETDFDCEDNGNCPPEVYVEPKLNYLARDFNSIRKLMLDRMHVLAPDWREDHLADFMQVMVDLKAYVSDYQHYQLDAINTEAYLFTARSRVSVRRHARLVDYMMHDGCSPRVWVHIRIDEAVSSGVTVSANTQLFTRVPGFTPTFEIGTQTYREALERGPQVFETMHEATLFSAHNEMCFYTWGDANCVLARGATRATLADAYPDLKAGDVLIFEEVRGARTGDPADADPAKRFAVRLISVDATQIDTLYNQPVTEIAWHPDDALPSPLCLSAVTESAEPLPDSDCNPAISVARGNIVLAQHGLLQPIESLGIIPENSLFYGSDTSRCEPEPPEAVPPRFRPRLQSRPVAQHIEYKHSEAANSSEPLSAKSVMLLDPAKALPAIVLGEEPTVDTEALKWSPQHDLFNTDRFTRRFVLEVENDGGARIRFGDDETGMRPDSGTAMYARYRVGDPLAGSIGADAIAHVITTNSAIIAARNPLTAYGGQAPEGMEAVRQNAPQAFRVQERAVTPEDYENVALRYAGVQRAAATIRWTGSWYTVYLTVDRLGGTEIDEQFEADFRAHMNKFRMMGYDLEIDTPHYVPVELRLEVCVKPEYFRFDVERALREIFSANVLRDGTKGVFHPDNFTFGQTMFLSRIYAAAATVPGVQSVEVVTFQVQDQPSRSGLSSGMIALGRLEIAQLENDPNFPKRGVFSLDMKGGK